MIERMQTVGVLVLCVLSVQGCAMFGARGAVLDEDQAQLVARDFVSALSQLRGFAPRNTTVQMHPLKGDFGELLAEELRDAGFGMQIVPENEDAPMLVSYEARGFESGAGESAGYRVRVGAVELGREYEIRAGRVFPMTALSVRGRRIDSGPLDESIFDRRLADDRTRDHSDAELLSARDDSPQAWREIPASARSASRTALENGFQTNDLDDVLASGGAHFEPLLETEIIEQHVLRFSDDSTRLWEKNREPLMHMAEAFDPEHEMISVIGYSHGPTSVPARNRALALGRADRVRVELVAQGIDAKHVLEDGSWASSRVNGLPARAVIVTRHRRPVG